MEISIRGIDFEQFYGIIAVEQIACVRGYCPEWGGYEM